MRCSSLIYGVSLLERAAIYTERYRYVYVYVFIVIATCKLIIWVLRMQSCVTSPLHILSHYNHLFPTTHIPLYIIYPDLQALRCDWSRYAQWRGGSLAMSTNRLLTDYFTGLSFLPFSLTMFIGICMWLYCAGIPWAQGGYAVWYTYEATRKRYGWVRIMRDGAIRNSILIVRYTVRYTVWTYITAHKVGCVRE